MNRIKVGLLMDSLTVPNWICKLIEKINESNYAEVSLIVMNTANNQASSRLNKVVNNFNEVFFAAYKKLENKVHPIANDAFYLKDVSSLLRTTPTVSVKPIQKKFSDTIIPDDIEKIKSYNIDVFLRFGFRILKGDILTIAKYGVWSYHHGDNTINRGMPAGTWEFLEKWPTTGSILQILSDELDGGQLLYRSQSATNTSYLNENRNNYYWKSAAFVPRMLKKLYEDRNNFIEKHVSPINQHPEFYSNKLYRNPGNAVIFKKILSKGWDAIKTRFNSLFYLNQWLLMYSLSKAEKPSFELYKYKKIIPPKDRFWADPHVVYNDNKYYIFFEEVLYSEKNGRISVIEMDERGNYSSPQIALKTDYHLSYPFMLEADGKQYMIPETRANRSIELYETDNFPLGWKLKMKLMENVDAVDTTILFYNNKWWLFTNMREYDGASTSDELFLFYADDLLTKNWTPHPLNPIVSDFLNARPAGRVFIHNGNLYRPAQICTPFYGWGVAINHISKLTEQEYQETTVSSIKPHWEKNVRQVHTLSYCNKLTVIDANIRRSRIG
ncbi:MAG: glucosamine inositolphosphorylceramide transferase family protein [Flavipsychrobacter sp.]